MNATQNQAESTANREILSSRVLQAPRELVWKVFSEAEHLSQWWGPRGFTNNFQEFEFKKEGRWRFIMRGPDGKDYKNDSVFLEIEKPPKIVFRHHSPDFTATILLEDLGDKTKITWRNLFDSVQTYESVKSYAVPGLEQNLDRLEERLPILVAGKEFNITRLFDAPPELVFKAWTEPEHLSRWFGPKGTVVKSVQMDLRPGGSLLSCMEFNDHASWGKWVFREITPPRKLVYVNSFSDEKGGLTRHPMSPTWPLEMLTTVTFEEQNGKTHLTLTWVPLHSNAEEIQTFLGALEGMKGGWTGSFDNLGDELMVMKKGLS